MLNQEEYDKKKAMYNETLRDLCDLHYADGLHTGRWEDEYAREESCKEYLAVMVALAEKYNLIYNENLEDYIINENDPECYAMDNMGSELQEIVEKHLLEILIHKNG